VGANARAARRRVVHRFALAGPIGLTLLAAVPAGGAGPDPDPDRTIVRETPPVVVEAVRPAELPEDPSSFATVIEVEEFAGEFKSVPDLLDETVSVQVRRFGGEGDRSEISIRGSTSSQVVILLDGIRLNTAQSGSVDLSTIPPELIERIEVQRGGGSVQAGSDAIGGVVNIVTKRPSATPQTSATVSGGSWGTWNAAFSRTQRVGDNELVLGYEGFRTDGDWEFQPIDRNISGAPVPGPSGSVERINNHSVRHSALGRIGRDLGDHFHLSAGDSFFYGDGGDPGLDAFGGANLGQSATAHRTRWRNVADVKLDAAGLGGGWDGQLMGFYRYDRSRFVDETPPFGAPTDSDNRNHALGGRLRAEREAEWGASEHLGSLGFEGRRDWLVAKDAPDADRYTLGVWLQDDVRLFESVLRLVPGIRFDYTEGFGGEWMPRIGAVVQPLSWLRFKANYERSYRVPNFDELFFDEQSLRGNPNLLPEDAWNADLGLELGFERLGPLEAVSLEFAVFRNDIDNSIVFQVVSPSVVQATNTGQALVRGLEVAGSVRVIEWVTLSANYTHLDTEVEATGNPLPGRPRDEANGRIEIGPPSRAYRMTFDVLYTGDIPVTSSGNSVVSARTVYDASLVVDLSWLPVLRPLPSDQELLFSFIGRNLSDQSVRDARSFPQPGRSFTFGFSGRW
jgi:outer membrane cobalamin receptor